VGVIPAPVLLIEKLSAYPIPLVTRIAVAKTRVFKIFLSTREGIPTEAFALTMDYIGQPGEILQRAFALRGLLALDARKYSRFDPRPC
jgi:hypothetical protein